jgi:hypothetical protein
MQAVTVSFATVRDSQKERDGDGDVYECSGGMWVPP